MMAWMMKTYKRKMTLRHFLVKDQVVKMHQTFQQQLERYESCEYSPVQWQASEASISHGLQVLGKTPFAKKRWQPSLGNMDSPPVPSCSKRSYLSNPTRESRFDNKGHFPMLVEKQNRWKNFAKLDLLMLHAWNVRYTFAWHKKRIGTLLNMVFEV